MLLMTPLRRCCHPAATLHAARRSLLDSGSGVPAGLRAATTFPGGVSTEAASLPNYYAILGVSRAATPEEIKAAFRQQGTHTQTCESAHFGSRGTLLPLAVAL